MTMDTITQDAPELTLEEREAIKAAAVEELRSLIGEDVEAIVLTKPACVQCTATYRDLDSKGVEYGVFSVYEDHELLETAKRAGYLQAPIVVTREDHWSGFRPDKIAEIVATRLVA